MKRIGMFLMLCGMVGLSACGARQTEGGSTTEVTNGGVSPEPAATDAAETATMAPDSTAIITNDSTADQNNQK